jgi:protein SCO1
MRCTGRGIVVAAGLIFFTLLHAQPGLGSGSGGPGLLEQSKEILATTAPASPQWVEEKLGNTLPLDASFVDEQGRQVRLREIIDRPTIILPIYFYCPSICSKNLANLAVALNNLTLQAGRDYRVIALSFNPAEGPADAARAKRNYVKILAEGFPAEEWYFLTGKAEEITAVTDALGFRFEKVDDETFIHPAALMTLTATGQVNRYIYGSFLAGDIDVGLAEAAGGRLSTSVRRLLEFCFSYDPRQNQSLFQGVKIGVLAVFAAVLVFVLFFSKRKGRRHPPAASDRKEP